MRVRSWVRQSEEALYEIASLRALAHLSLGEPIPDETTILNFRRLLEANDLADDILAAVSKHLERIGLLLKKGSIVDATIIAAPSSTKNQDGQRDPERHQTKRGNQWHFGMKAHIAVDADSGLVHTVTTTAANESDVEQIAEMLHALAGAMCPGPEAEPNAEDYMATRLALNVGSMRQRPRTCRNRAMVSASASGAGAT